MNLIDNQAPTKRQLEQNGYKSFVSAYTRYVLKLNEIIVKAGLKVNLDKDKQNQLVLQGTPISQKSKNGESSNEKVDKEESKEEKEQKEEVPESSNRKDFDTVIKEIKEQHPFDSRFNKVEEEEDFNDPHLWISPMVREKIEENKEKLLEKIRERSVRYNDSLSKKESLNYSEKDDLEKEPKNSFIKESSKESLVENQPLINPEIGIEPVNYMQHQKEPLPDMGKSFVSERTSIL